MVRASHTPTQSCSTNEASQQLVVRLMNEIDVYRPLFPPSLVSANTSVQAQAEEDRFGADTTSTAQYSRPRH